MTRTPVENSRRRVAPGFDSITCKTYTDDEKLPEGVLNRFCKNFSVDVYLPKFAQVNEHCHCLGVSTAGDDLFKRLTARNGLNNKGVHKLKSLTSAFPYCLTDWTADLSLVPPVDDIKI
jgi:hypothetical protein